jgi:energy-coupling factor transport system ATP-binding protein
MTNPEPAVLIRDLSFRYPKTISGRSVHALREISLRIDPGEVVVITGPSGSGKSSLCRCFNGLIPHATKGLMKGDVFIGGVNTRDHEISEFAPRVGLVFQDPDYQLITGDVTSEIAYGLEVLGLPPEEMGAEIQKWAEILHIRHLIGRSICDLSWGERQRVAIASVLAMHPSILVMDEPFSGIDTSAGQVLCETIRNIRRDPGTTVIIFEHRLSLLAGTADRLVILEDGKIAADGPFPAADLPSPDAGLYTAENAYCPSEKSPAGLPGSSGDVPAPGRPAGIAFRKVHFQYSGSTNAIFDGISLDFYPGEIAVITGQNGSGKTTLLKLCNGLLHPDAGDVLVQELPVGNRTVANISAMVGLLCQHADFQLFESTITDELAFAPKNLGMSRDGIARRMESVVRECVLDHIDPETPPLGLSGGEKQRVAIAGLFMMDTPVVILDEPTFGLDGGLKHALAAALGKMRDEKKTVIIATHDEEFAALCADRYIGISGGRIVKECRVTRNLHTGNTTGPESGMGAGEGGGVS